MAYPLHQEHHHGADAISEEQLQVFMHSCVRFTPSPPPPDSSSMLSSVPGEEIFTPSPSPSQGQPFDLAEVGSIVRDTNAFANDPPTEYASSLAISSPSDSLGGVSDASPGPEQSLNSSFIYQGTASERYYPPLFQASATNHFVPNYQYQENSAFGQRELMYPNSVIDTSFEYPENSADGFPVQFHPDMDQSVPVTTSPNYTQPFLPSQQLGQFPFLLRQEVDQGLIGHGSSLETLFAGSAQDRRSTPGLLLPSYQNPAPALLLAHYDPSSTAALSSLTVDTNETSSRWPLRSDDNPNVSGSGSATSVSPDTQKHDERWAVQRATQSRNIPPTPLISNTHARSPASSDSNSAPSPCSPHSRSSFRKKGGRPKGKGLEKQARKEAADLRGNACWPCAVNREKCSQGGQCERCSRMSSRSKAHGLGCDRRHLKNDMMVSFIPSSMDPSRLYTDVMSYLTQDVGRWHEDSRALHCGIEIPFSIGVGRPLTWKCYEYHPASQDSMTSLSWTIDGRGDSWRRTYKRSPPLALKALQPERLQYWINSFLDDDLEEIGEIYYWEGHHMRTDLVKLLCTLYGSLRNDDSLTQNSTILKDDLRRVISLILVTFVMNHAFTVEESFRDTVIRQLSCYNDPRLYRDLLILRTANSQLKYGFSRLRYDMHLTLLNRLQTILRNAKYKEWWLSAFVIMLGLALTLEEYEHLLHVQADSRRARGVDEATTLQEASANSAAIDDGYDFLMKLYHYKYSVRNEQQAAFPFTTKIPHHAEEEFVHKLEALLRPNYLVLLQRKDLTVSYDGENHVLRLVGRLLTGLI